MQTTTVSKLKMSISACLRQVKAGEELLITEHGRPVARLLPVANIASLPKRLAEMEKKGLLKRAGKPLPEDFWDLPRAADPKAALSSAVSEERKESIPWQENEHMRVWLQGNRILLYMSRKSTKTSQSTPVKTGVQWKTCPERTLYKVSRATVA